MNMKIARKSQDSNFKGHVQTVERNLPHVSTGWTPEIVQHIRCCRWNSLGSIMDCNIIRCGQLNMQRSVTVTAELNRIVVEQKLDMVLFQEAYVTFDEVMGLNGNVYTKRVWLRLTYDGEVDPAVARLRHLEVDAAAVDAGVALLYVVYAELCGLLVRHEVGAVRENSLVRPALRLRELPLSRVHAAKHDKHTPLLRNEHIVTNSEGRLSEYSQANRFRKVRMQNRRCAASGVSNEQTYGKVQHHLVI
ncbi:hypothetical protein PR048_024841 [Dryococelus australis]|uniref:Endonuclease/exonuclease/phosphatase domain-containing protein n=1 Tax=Dryococelus australis TaxID=614101 RepID=A0ABQ9GPQ1_9NEOP|nr:hypothetical protein PR048_024841 [Dryococelus australis]